MQHSMHIDRFKRVIVVGTSGSGKTMLARALSEILQVSHVELDALFWGPNWVPNPESEYLENLADRLAPGSWVVDGNISSQNCDALRPATAIVWLNYSFPTVFGRALRRTFRRIVSREYLYADNQESIGQIFDSGWIPWWVIRTFSKRRREYRALFSSPEFSGVEVVELRDLRAAERLLENLRAA